MFRRRGGYGRPAGDAAVVDHIPTEDELYRFFWPSAAGFAVLVGLKLLTYRGLLGSEPAKDDPLGTELRKAVPVAFALLVAWMVHKLQTRFWPPVEEPAQAAEKTDKKQQ